MPTPPLVTTVQSEADIQGILTLQRQNLRRVLAPRQQTEQGFLTLEHDPSVLRRMNQAAPSIVAKAGNTVVGFCLTMLPSFGDDIPELVPLFEHLQRLTFEGRPLPDYPYYVMGQVCVDEAYRGHGLFDAMYARHRLEYGHRFQLLVTDIAERNTRSRRAHARVGFREIHSFFDPALDETWVVVAWDWRKA